MRNGLIISLLLLSVLVCFSGNRGIATSLKEDYYREMASRMDMNPDLRIVWLDSLLSLECDDEEAVLLEKIRLLREEGYPAAALPQIESFLKTHRNLADNELLPFLYQRASCLYDLKDFSKAISGFNRILQIPKVDSLKYWDIEVCLSLFSVYSDLGNNVRADDWLNKIAEKLSTYPLAKEFREDAEGRVHGSRATLLITAGNYDSAYKELRIVHKLARADRSRFSALVQTAQLYLEQGHNEAARQYLEKAFALDVNGQSRRTAVYLLALSYLREHRFNEALSILGSYPRQTVRENSMGNQRAFYIIRGQAALGAGDFFLAYTSLDSALVVGDSIMANMSRFQAVDAESLLQAGAESARQNEALRKFTVVIMVLEVALVVILSAAIPLLLSNIRLRRRISMRKQIVENARIEMQNIKIDRTKNREVKDNMIRRQSALLLRLAHLESALDGLKRSLSNDGIDSVKREELLRKLQDISGKENMWELFSMQFEQSNSRFLDLLSRRHPELTKSEKRICAFMLINLSTKEIAGLLDRSPRTIDVTKYNIRKKLGIEMPTEEYLKNLASEAATMVDSEVL